MQLHKLCMGCMSDKGDNKICPLCGWNENLVSENPVHLRAGTLLYDKYMVGKVLGNGGFGITYLGWDKVLSRKVAIKEYLPQQFSTRYAGENNVTIFTSDNELQYNSGLEKFLEEAKILAKFGDHQNIVSVYDFFRLNNTAYIVMNYVDGITLKEYLNAMGESIQYAKALGIIGPVMNALNSVHKVNILHRDISPGNIYMCKNGQIKLIDFGASRQVVGDLKSLSVILKPGFAPEEQYRSRGVQGPWTDVYAVAATFYRMLAGEPPQEALERLSEDTIEWESECWKDVPVDAIDCLKVALSVRSKDRYQSIKDFSNELFKNDNLYNIIQNSSEELGSEVDTIAKEINRNKQKNYIDTKEVSALNHDNIDLDKTVIRSHNGGATSVNVPNEGTIHIKNSDTNPEPMDVVVLCSRCGEKLYENEMYCSNCGNKVISQIESPKNDISTKMDSTILNESNANEDSTILKESNANEDSTILKESNANENSTILKESTELPKSVVKVNMSRRKKYIIFSSISLLIILGIISIRFVLIGDGGSQTKAVNSTNKATDSVKVKSKEVIRTISKEEAINIASKIVGELPKGYHLDYDSIQKIDNKEYHMIHFYETIIDNQQTGASHKATCEWYYIDISDGNIYRMDTATGKLVKVTEKWSGQLKKQQIVYSKYTNDKFGFSIDYPSDLLTKVMPLSQNGSIFSSKDDSVKLTVSGKNNVSNQNAKSVYNDVIKEHSDALYKTQQNNWFVVSWIDGDKIYYEWCTVGSGSINTYIAAFPESQKKYFELVLNHLNSSFKNPGVGKSH
ncbi:protein kinase domain-containing protein [Clostridium sp.]|uniref:protein kinase domain-containing protein n=1 Tax=Clostridium sp. TaxID=1506 RepID=UPI002609D433|nr:protein kinase [uncultured Clostridium sp.]